jgi:tight adherence protein B
MTTSLTFVLVTLSLFSLIGLGLSGVLVSQSQVRREKRLRRLRDLAVPYQKTFSVKLAIFRPAAPSNRSLVESLASLFGIQSRNLAQYPVKWWIVVGIALLLSRGVAQLAIEVIGQAGFIAMPVIWVLMCRGFFGQVSGRRKKALVEQFPDALAMIVRSVRVGVPVIAAISAVGLEAQEPTSIEFTRLSDELTVGVPLDEAATEMGVRNSLPEYRFFAIAIGLQARAGGGLSETLENLADLIRKRLALQERGHALSSEARTSALILGGLPVVMGVGLWLLNPGYMAVLFTTGTGHTILAAAVGSLSCGAFAMKTIIKKSLS